MDGARYMSLNSLREITGSLLEVNQDVIKVIMEVKQDEMKSTNLSSLMKEYMETSLRNLDLCSALERCIRCTRNGQSIIQHQLHEAADDGGQDKTLILKTKEELRKLLGEDGPCSGDLTLLFESSYSRTQSLLDESDKQKLGLDRTLKSLKTWSKLSTVVFAIGYFLVLILTGVTFVVSVPSPVEVLAGALSATIGSMGKWINYYCKKEEKRVQERKESVITVKLGAFVMLKDMENTRVFMDKWRSGIQQLMRKADAIAREEEEVQEMIKEWESFKRIPEELEGNVATLSEDTRLARISAVKKIVALGSSDEEKASCLDIIM